jgi:hypothetical protein
LLGHGLSAGRPDRQLVREPVRASDHEETEHQSDNGSTVSTEHAAKENRQPTQTTQKNCGFEIVEVHSRSLPSATIPNDIEKRRSLRHLNTGVVRTIPLR